MWIKNFVCIEVLKLPIHYAVATNIFDKIEASGTGFMQFLITSSIKQKDSWIFKILKKQKTFFAVQF